MKMNSTQIHSRLRMAWTSIQIWNAVITSQTGTGEK